MTDDDRMFDEQILRMLYGDLFDHFIDRAYAEVPDTLLPSAKYVALASDNLLSLVHPKGRKVRLYRTTKWVKNKDDESVTRALAANDNFLLVRQCGSDWDKWGDTFTVERKFDAHEILTLDFDPPVLILCREFKQAMVLAERCCPSPRQEANGLRWVSIAA